jgi:hypothetical protein
MGTVTHRFHQKETTRDRSSSIPAIAFHTRKLTRSIDTLRGSARQR